MSKTMNILETRFFKNKKSKITNYEILSETRFVQKDQSPK